MRGGAGARSPPPPPIRHVMSIAKKQKQNNNLNVEENNKNNHHNTKAPPRGKSINLYKIIKQGKSNAKVDIYLVWFQFKHWHFTPHLYNNILIR